MSCRPRGPLSVSWQTLQCGSISKPAPRILPDCPGASNWVASLAYGVYTGLAGPPAQHEGLLASFAVRKQVTLLQMQLPGPQHRQAFAF